MSYVDQDGEWKFRKITLMGVVRSFVSQLRPGQDLTRVSLPAVLLHPYSMLEVIGYRELTYFELLLELNRETDPMQRMLIVLRWILSTIQQETFHKKPYNPVLAETHECHIASEQYGKTEFIAEQVSHHPPISAFIVANAQENINLSSNISFNVKFGGNYVSVVTEGPAMISVEDRAEQYEMSKCLPDMVIRNVVWGTKRIFWSGEISISCPTTGYSASLVFGESGSDNTVKGTLTDDQGEVIYKMEGKAGAVIYMTNPKGERKILIDVQSVNKPKITYQTKSELDPLASLAVWADVSKYIIDNDMEKADEAKKKIEGDQRLRTAERKEKGLEATAKYFQGTEFGWVFKSNKTASDSESEKSDDSDEESPPQRKKSPSPLAEIVKSPEVKPVEEKSNSKTRESREVKEEKTGKTPEKKTDDRDRTMSPKPDAKPQEDRKDEAIPSRRSEERRIPARSEDPDEEELSRSPKVSKASSLITSGERNRSSRDPLRESFHDSHDEDDLSPSTGSFPGKRGSLGLGINKSNSTPVMPTQSKKKWRMSLRRDNSQKETDLDKGEKKRLREEAKHQLSLKPSTVTTGNKPTAVSVTAEETIMSGWMKMRNSMKIWVNRYFVLRPGKLIYFRDEKEVAKERCAGILRLADCKVKERLASKDGCSFKIQHLLHYPIYHKYGLRGETLKLAMIPVSWSHCIVRVNTAQERKQWIEAITDQIAYANEHDRHNMNSLPDMKDFDDDEDDDDEEVEFDDERIFSSPEPEKEDKDDKPDTSPPSAREISNELFFVKHENLHRALMEGLSSQQEVLVKKLNSKTMKQMEQWKKEIDMRFMNVEKKMTTALNQTKEKPANKIQLSYVQLFIVVFLALLVGKLLQWH